MAKRSAYLHVGLPHSGGSFLPAALAAHGPALEAAGLRQPARSADEMFRAVVEVRRDHRSWGLRRRDVEGTWADICRRAYKGSDDVVVGHDLLAGATHDEISLLLDRLPGFDVHVLVTAGPADPRLTLFPDDHDLAAVVERWASHVRTPDRVHVVVTDPVDREVAWRAAGAVLGFDASALPLPADLPTPPDDLASLRLLATSAGTLASPEELAEAADQWAKAIADGGYDVRGDLAGLSPRPARATNPAEASTQERLALVSEALSDAVAEVSRLRQRSAELEERVATLERKRKKLKRRLTAAAS